MTVIEMSQKEFLSGEAARKEKERLRGAARRKAKKEKKEAERTQTIHEYWTTMLKSVDAGQLKKWQERQEFVLSLIQDINNVLTGAVPDAEFFQDVVEEMKNDVEEFGICCITVPLLIGPFWTEPKLLAKLTSGNSPSANFAKYGYLTAVDDYTKYKWEAHLAGLVPHAKIPQYFGTLTCGCGSTTSAPTTVVNAYRGKVFTCSVCRAKEAIPRAAVAQAMKVEYGQPESIIFDGFGRFKDSSTDGGM